MTLWRACSLVPASAWLVGGGCCPRLGRSLCSTGHAYGLPPPSQPWLKIRLRAHAIAFQLWFPPFPCPFVALIWQTLLSFRMLCAVTKARLKPPIGHLAQKPSRFPLSAALGLPRHSLSLPGSPMHRGLAAGSSELLQAPQKDPSRAFPRSRQDAGLALRAAQLARAARSQGSGLARRDPGVLRPSVTPASGHMRCFARSGRSATRPNPASLTVLLLIAPRRLPPSGSHGRAGSHPLRSAMILLMAGSTRRTPLYLACATPPSPRRSFAVATTGAQPSLLPPRGSGWYPLRFANLALALQNSFTARRRA